MLFKRLDHVAFRVADPKPVVDYYVKALDFHIVKNMEIKFGDSRAISNVLNLPGSPFFIFVDQGL